MHSIPLDEDLPPLLPGDSDESSLTMPMPKQAEVEVLGDLRGHVLGGRYVLTELLGSGDLGCVYSGKDQSSGQAVTVKVLASQEHREVIGRIADRVRRRLGVRHRSVAAVLSEGTMGGLWYAVMEHAPGKNAYHAEDDPRFEGAGLLALAAELAEGLATLHALGAPHGAISPHNLVWSEAGVKLVDLDVQLSGETAEEPSAWADVTALAKVIRELAGVGEDRAPWVAAVTRVARGELRPTAAEWVGQLRSAEIEALKPAVAAAAQHGEGVIDSAWDALFEEAGSPAAPAKKQPPPIEDTGIKRIEPPPQLAMVSFEAESGPPTMPPVEAEPAGSASPPPAPVSETKLAARFEARLEAATIEKPPAEVRPAPRPAVVIEPGELKKPVEAKPVEAKPVDVKPKLVESAPSPLVSSPSVTAVRESGWSVVQAPTSRKHLTMAVGLLAIALLCALIGWRLQAWATAGSGPPKEEPPPAPQVEAPAPAPTAANERSNLSPETATLARANSPELPPGPTPMAAVPEPMPTADDPEEAIEPIVETTGEDGGDQLSAADFRKVLLRANRTQKVKSCYDRHGGAGSDDVELVALIGRGGKVLKLRMPEDPLSDCLRKVVLRLEFPRAERQAQHNFVFHRPTE